MDRGLRLRIAAGFAQRARGLLWHMPLRENDALLIPGCHAVHTCGLRYALDVVFLDASGHVLAVAAGLAPWRYAAHPRAATVLELAAGSAARFGFVPGARLGAIASVIGQGALGFSAAQPRPMPQVNTRHPQLTIRLLNRARAARGASLAELVLVVPLLLFLILALLQIALAFHAKSQLDYATVVAARAGTMANASREVMGAAFVRAMAGYYGGGRNQSQLLQSIARATADLAAGHVRIEVLSPSVESFGDYNSPELQRRLNTKNARVIPNDDVGLIECPRDVPGCNPDPRRNRSGQTLADANLLKIRVTFGIAPTKQVPIVGRFFAWALAAFNPADNDAFQRALLAEGRIPLVAHTVLRMQSPTIEDHNASNPGAGNNGAP